MNIYIPMWIMLISLIFIIISIFLLYYYDKPLYAFILFVIGIIMGIIACIIFIYLRTPKSVKNVAILTPVLTSEGLTTPTEYGLSAPEDGFATEVKNQVIEI